MIETCCPSCGKRYRVKEEHAGRSARCRGCGAQINFPTEGAAPEADPAGDIASPMAAPVALTPTSLSSAELLRLAVILVGLAIVAVPVFLAGPFGLLLPGLAGVQMWLLVPPLMFGLILAALGLGTGAMRATGYAAVAGIGVLQFLMSLTGAVIVMAGIGFAFAVGAILMGLLGAAIAALGIIQLAKDRKVAAILVGVGCGFGLFVIQLVLTVVNIVVGASSVLQMLDNMPNAPHAFQ
jgi:hypothetical protein